MSAIRAIEVLVDDIACRGADSRVPSSTLLGSGGGCRSHDRSRPA
jgi:hypothetical protein